MNFFLPIMGLNIIVFAIGIIFITNFSKDVFGSIKYLYKKIVLLSHQHKIEEKYEFETNNSDTDIHLSKINKEDQINLDVMHDFKSNSSCNEVI